MAAVVPAAVFAGTLLLLDAARRGYDLTDRDMFVAIAVCAAAIGYYVLLLIEQQRARPQTEPSD